MRPRLLLALSVSLSILACADDGLQNPEPGNTTPLGVWVEEKGAGGGDPLLVEAYLDVVNGGFPDAQVRLDWGTIEHQLLAYDWSELDRHARQAAQRGVGLAVTLVLVEGEGLGSVPADLEGQTWDGANFRIRAARFGVAVLERARGTLHSLWIGREVDRYFVHHPEEVDAFRGLVAACADSMALVAPEVRVGTAFAFDAEAGARAATRNALLPGLTVVGFAVYGRDADYAQQRSPEETLALARDALASVSIPAVLTEIGFPALQGRDEQLEFARALTSFLEVPPANLERAYWSQLYDLQEERAAERAETICGEDADCAAGYATQVRALGLRDLSGAITATWLHVAGWNIEHTPIP